YLFPGAEDADVAFDFVVIRGKIFVTDRPVVAEAIARAGFEIDGRKTQSDAAPVIGAAADDTRAEPREIGAGSGSVGLAGNFPGAVGSEKLAEIVAGVGAHSPAPSRQPHPPTHTS